MTEEHKRAPLDRERTVNRIRSLQTRQKTAERTMKRAQYVRKEDFYHHVTDTVKALGYSLLGEDAAAPHLEARFDAFVEKAEQTLIAIVNDCLLAINALEDNVRTARAESAKALATLLDELGKEDEDVEYMSSCSTLTAGSRCRVSTRKITRTIREKISTSGDKARRVAPARLVMPAGKSRSVSSMSSGRTYVIGTARPPHDVVQRRYYMKEREAMFEERKSRPVVNLPKVNAKGAWGQTWHMKLVERKRLSLVDMRCRNKYAENRMGDSFQVFKEVKAIWKSNMMCGKEEAVAANGDEGTGSGGGKARVMSAARRDCSPVKRMGKVEKVEKVEKEAKEAKEAPEEIVSVTQYDDLEELMPKWVKRVQKKES